MNFQAKYDLDITSRNDPKGKVYLNVLISDKGFRNKKKEKIKKKKEWKLIQGDTLKMDECYL